MKLQKKLLVALIAVAFSSGAQAAIDRGDPSGNGSLFLNVKSVESPVTGADDSVSAAFDLGFNMNSVRTWNGVDGLKLSWNLSTGAFTSNNTLITGAAPALTYASAFNTFNTSTNFDLAKAQMSVIALDGTDPGTVGEAGVRVMTTGNLINATGTSMALTATTGPSNGQLNSTPNNGGVTAFMAALNNAANHNTVENGASNAVAGTDGYYDNAGGMDKFANQASWFDNTGLYDGSYAAGTGILSGEAKAMPFFLVTSSSTNGISESVLTRFGVDLDLDGVIEFDNNTAGVAGGSNEFALFTLQGSVLSFTNPTATVVPVPAAVWLLGSGLLGLVGVARRKQVKA